MLLVIFLLYVSIGACASGEPRVGSKDATYLQLRTLGFAAYAEDHFTDAAVYFTRAIDNYWFRKKVQSLCIEQCRDDENLNSDEVQTISMYLSTSGCVERCCRRRLGDPILVEDPVVDEIFRRNQYYDVIQTCWSHATNYTGNLEAAVTFTLHNPSHVGMNNRLKDLYRITERDGIVIPRMEPWYNTQYRTGVQHYNSQEWGPCVYHLEGALTHFMYSTNMCRAQCTYPYDRTVISHKTSSFISAAEEIIKTTAECRQQCYEDLPLRPLSEAPYLAGILEYLQFCQYQLGDVQDAVDTTVSYLLLHKRNKIIQENMGVFKQHQLEGTPREDIEGFLRNYRLDVGLEVTKQQKVEQEQDSTTLFLSENYYGNKGLITHKQCRGLIHLAKEAAIENDGYDLFKDQETSPFTDFEKFSGIQLEAVVEMLEEGAIEVEEVQLYMDTVLAAKEHIEQKLLILRPLYFDYIHLVKRSALADAGRPENDLSHPIHGDNCLIQEDGSCIKDNPAFTHRDWSAIVYLNTPKQGGEFIITDKKMKALETATPQCGTVVGFSGDTLHGVKSLVDGERYAIGLWYTHDINEAIDMGYLQRRIDYMINKEKEDSSKSN